MPYAGLSLEGQVALVTGSARGIGKALAIGLALTLIHLISIPVTNTSVNPARSTGPALFVGGWALAQLWLFWLAPLMGGALGGGGTIFLYCIRERELILDLFPMGKVVLR